MQHLRLKGLELISQSDSTTFEDWRVQTFSWLNKNAANLAMVAIDAAEGGSDFYAVVDDEKNSLISICTYDILPASTFDFIDVPFDECIVINHLAGAGKGGSRMIIEDIKHMASIMNIPIFLMSDIEAAGFYEKMGFELGDDSFEDKVYYYYPDELKKEMELKNEPV